MSSPGTTREVREPQWDALDPVLVRSELRLDPRWRPAPMASGRPGQAWAVTPYCTCPGRGHYADRGDGKYRCGECWRPAVGVWERTYNGGETVDELAARLAAASSTQSEHEDGSVPHMTESNDWMAEARAEAARAEQFAHDAYEAVDGFCAACVTDPCACGAAEPEAARAPASALKVSNSEIRAFKRCRRKWWLSYYRALRQRREGVGPLSLGNMVHKPLEAYYGTPDRDPATFDWATPLAQHVEERLADPALPESKHEQMLQDYELAKIMLRGYFEWLVEEGADSELEILAPEREIQAFLGAVEGTDVWLIGKLDVEARRRSDGAKAFVDHKSCQTLSDIPKTGKLDEQLKTYGLLQRLEALADGTAGRVEYANGGTWNMLRKVKRTASAKPPFYGRAGVTHNDEVYRTFFKRVWGEVRDMLYVRRALDSGGDHQEWAYPNPTRDCSWDCPFFAVCDQFDDGSDVESVLAIDYEAHDPYARYTEVEKG